MVPKNIRVAQLEAEIEKCEEEIQRYESRIGRLEKQVDKIEAKIEDIQEKCQHALVIEDDEWVCDKCGTYIADVCISPKAPEQKCVPVQVKGGGYMCQYCEKEMEMEEEEE